MKQFTNQRHRGGESSGPGSGANWSDQTGTPAASIILMQIIQFADYTVYQKFMYFDNCRWKMKRSTS